MKRIHLFEFEDLPWFPNWLRISLTRLIVVMHRLLDTTKELAALINKVMKYSSKPSIIDLCSGSGGSMLAVAETLKKEYQIKDLTLTDLYPNKELAHKVNSNGSSSLTYLTKSINAANVPSELIGVRTMVCSFHHM
ncbi:MAG: hypothetical protein M3142_14010, partial [Bacteroidota bacterium]|nr:hypothetical protein [Bacteroidota bacterium]